MYEDLTPDLIDKIKHEFKVILSHHADIQAIDRKVRRGIATQADISKYANFVGQAGSAAMKQVLKLDTLPDATMYEEIAEQTITPVMDDMYSYVNTEAALQLRSMDRKTGMNIGIRKGTEPSRRIKAVVDMASGQTAQEALDNALTDPVIATARKFYDDFQRENADLRDSLGFEEVVIRKYDDRGLHGGKDRCQWCLDREGTWSLLEAHINGVFERHPGCGCLIEVITPDKPQVQTDWTHNVWTDIPR